ncbi:universal stress protein [Marinobacter sp.]|uniref:universal stress protein n=1 Tax=Marinobacter sp. TaxID=50741 RepID=UPI00235703DD|nr:universal stress protein [Marinobacter sp.]
MLLLLDGSPTSYAALAAGVEIAGQTGAEVFGVFVEEINLLRSAGCSFSREVGSVSGISRPFDTALIERRMQRVADRARQILAKAVPEKGSGLLLSVARGRVGDEVLALAGPDDLLVLGRVGWSSEPGARLGSTARGLIRRSPGRVLLWCDRQAVAKGRVVVFLNDHDDANKRAVTTAAEISRRSGQPVTILLRPRTELSQERLEKLEQDLGVSEAGIRVRVLPSTNPAVIAHTVRQEQASYLVVSRECSLFKEPGANPLLVALNLPVMVTP